MLRSAILLALFGGAAAQAPGRGISKSTYACDDPIKGKKFMEKYFPVATPGDECDNDICICPAGTGGDKEWYIQQGRIYFTTSEASNTSATQRRLLQGPPGPGGGFGVHLVNVSNHLTTGGRSVAAVEGEFNTKLSGMTDFDAFMDYNVLLYTSDLAGYASAFKADGVPTYAASWSQGGKTYTSLFLHVQGQSVFELTSDQDQSIIAAALKTSIADLPTIEPRVAEGVVEKVSQEHKALGAGVYARTGSGTSKAICTGLAVNRAVSETEGTLDKIETFYVTGMGCTKTTDTTGKGPGTSGAFSKKCFQWPGATIDICFTARPDTATKGDWKVGDFEKMLNTVHENLLGGQPYCGVDKWFDNHYAIDSHTADTEKIVKYIDSAKVVHYCNTHGPGGGGVHYIFDPSGWGIQTDLGFSTQPSDCGGSSVAAKVEGTFNPACQPGTCTKL